MTPRPGISVGITGHRLVRLAPGQAAALTERADHILAAIAAEAMAAAAGRTPLLRLVTGLADGADSIFADAAIAAGWEVDAVLPFPRAEFAQDFAGSAARQLHAARLTAARAVLELPGVREPDSGSGQAYERAGRTVLAQCDILIAVWDNGPVRGRGGAAQIVAEAVLQGIPVVQIDPAAPDRPVLLWSGLDEHDLGEQTIETVARGDIGQLATMVGALIGRADRPRWTRWPGRPRRHPPLLARLWPLLLRLAGRPKASTVAPCAAEEAVPIGFPHTAWHELDARFDHADRAASEASELFRGGYVANFALAAVAVLLSLLGLALPAWFKPVLIVLELATIGTILMLTRIGNRSGWHGCWLENRQLAERLRCLAISARLGELDLRVAADTPHNWVEQYARGAARALGLPMAGIDRSYLEGVRAALVRMVDDQIAYFDRDAGRMHRLEHRLHRLGTFLFLATAFICVAFFLFELAEHLSGSPRMEAIAHPLVIAATIACAALPAIGAAIYGIRMQGDFAGVAERNHSLAHHLRVLRKAIDEDEIGFDTLRRRVRRATDLLTEDLANWLKTYRARPLSLPG